MDAILNQQKKVYPFNNSIETGLRVLSLLNASFPVAYDVGTIVIFDYLAVHSGDIDENKKSLHPPVPNRTGEIFVRRNIIEDGLELFVSRGLIDKIYSKSGIEYKANENSTPFLDSLSENYAIELIERAKWVIDKFSIYDEKDLRDMIRKSAETRSHKFNLEIIN